MAIEPRVERARAEDFYHRLRRRLDSWLATNEGRRYQFARLLVVVPDFLHLLIRLAFDGRVHAGARSQLVATLAYVMSPIDLLPEAFVGPMGFADDLVLMVLVVRRLLHSVPREVIAEHWAGEQDLFELVETVLETADQMIGGKRWSRLRKWIGEPQSSSRSSGQP